MEAGKQSPQTPTVGSQGPQPGVLPGILLIFLTAPAQFFFCLICIKYSTFFHQSLELVQIHLDLASPEAPWP